MYKRDAVQESFFEETREMEKGKSVSGLKFHIGQQKEVAYGDPYLSQNGVMRSADAIHEDPVSGAEDVILVERMKKLLLS